MATCPECKVSSRVDNTAMSVDEVLVAKPLGTWSLSGVQDKTVATVKLRLSCKCGWGVFGIVKDGYFEAEVSNG